jgi:L-ascorbate 6-phosphate lactonase
MLSRPDQDDDRYNFTRNDPFDRTRPIQLVVEPKMSSTEYMRSIRAYRVPEGSLAIWYLGQNGFILKHAASPLIGIDLYLTNSCGEDFTELPFRLDRQLPVFIEPEDLDIDVFITTHSHQDHADAATIRRLLRREQMLFVGPFDCQKVYEQSGVLQPTCRLLHPGEALHLGATTLTGTFALPTDNTDLNHSGMLLEFSSGITFFNTGDTAWAERLLPLLPTNVDICAVCINGGYHNLAPEQAAAIIQAVSPRVAVPCHYDMMVNNVGSPEMFRAALERLSVPSAFHMLRYYEPWLYTRTEISQPGLPVTQQENQ